MLIDDHAAMGVIFKTILTAMGCAPSDFDFVQDIDTAVEHLEAKAPYEIIFLDNIVPPTYHFRESLSMMRNLDDQTAIVLMSGEIPADFGTDPKDARINACLEKDDLSPARILALLNEFNVRLTS